MSEPTLFGDKSYPTHYRTANPYESLFGYSRGVRKGQFIFISGTTSTSVPSTSKDNDDTAPIILHPDSTYQQALHIFDVIIRSVESLGGKREDISRIRMFVRNEADSTDVGRALRESLGDVSPAATMILGAGFVNPAMKVEVEADAVVL